MKDISNMLPKHRTISEIVDAGIVAIVRTENPNDAENAVQACLAGGLNVVELSFTVYGAHNIIERLYSKVKDACVLGAGTILDSETARIAILSGASYIVSPSFDAQTALLCNRYAVPYIAGCYSPREIVQAMEYGVDIVKLFPAGLASPKAVKALMAPLPHANIMPTEGVTLDNVQSWINAGAVALGVGGDLTAGAETGNLNDVTKKAAAYKKAVEEARE